MLNKKKGLSYFLKSTLVNLAIARKGLLKFNNDNLSDLFYDCQLPNVMLYSCRSEEEWKVRENERWMI